MAHSKTGTVTRAQVRRWEGKTERPLKSAQPSHREIPDLQVARSQVENENILSMLSSNEARRDRLEKCDPLEGWL